MTNNSYIPFLSEIKDVIRHTPVEYTFRMTYEGAVKPGQFFEDFAHWKKNMDVILTVDCAEDDTKCQIGLVTEYIPGMHIKDSSKAVAVVVGPPMMMKFTVKGLLDAGFQEENIWVSFERKMCCGLGKCGHCRINDTYVCLDGPVFNYTEGKNLVD